MKNSLAVWILSLLFLAGCAQRQDAALHTDEPVVQQDSINSSDAVAPSRPAPSESGEDEDSARDENEYLCKLPLAPHTDEDFVRVTEYIPDIYVDLRYATENNFTGELIYLYTDAWLRYGTVKKLETVQKSLQEQGFSLCIWDAFRSVQSQERLWAAYPDGNYVANPANGYSGHTRGDTVDITLVTSGGGAVAMPSDFDTFTAAADRDYSDVSEEAASNARLLEQAMIDSGFDAYEKEWWHYSDTVQYPPAVGFEPPET